MFRHPFLLFFSLALTMFEVEGKKGKKIIEVKGKKFIVKTKDSENQMKESVKPP